MSRASGWAVGLTLVGLVCELGGLGIGAVTAVVASRRLAKRYAAIGGTDEQRSALGMTPETTYNDVTYMKTVVLFLIAQSDLRGVKWTASLLALGVVLTSAGGLVSLLG